MKTKALLTLLVLTFSSLSMASTYQFCGTNEVLIDSEIQGRGVFVVGNSEDEIQGHYSFLVCSDMDKSYLKLLPLNQNIQISTADCERALSALTKRKARAVNMEVSEGVVTNVAETDILCSK